MESIDKKSLSFTIPIMDNGELHTLYVPAPTRARADAAAPVLGSLFSLKETSGLAPLVLARDYEVYADRACQKLAEENSKISREIEKEKDQLFKNFEGFIEASIMAAHVISPVEVDGKKEFKIMKIADAKLSEQSLEYATGAYVFFYITYRYAWMVLGNSEKEVMTTSLSIMDFIKHLQTL